MSSSTTFNGLAHFSDLMSVGSPPSSLGRFLDFLDNGTNATKENNNNNNIFDDSITNLNANTPSQQQYRPWESEGGVFANMGVGNSDIGVVGRHVVTTDTTPVLGVSIPTNNIISTSSCNQFDLSSFGPNNIGPLTVPMIYNKSYLNNSGPSSMDGMNTGFSSLDGSSFLNFSSHSFTPSTHSSLSTSTASFATAPSFNSSDMFESNALMQLQSSASSIHKQQHHQQAKILTDLSTKHHLKSCDNDGAKPLTGNQRKEMLYDMTVPLSVKDNKKCGVASTQIPFSQHNLLQSQHPTLSAQLCRRTALTSAPPPNIGSDHRGMNPIPSHMIHHPNSLHSSSHNNMMHPYNNGPNCTQPASSAFVNGTGHFQAGLIQSASLLTTAAVQQSNVPKYSNVERPHHLFPQQFNTHHHSNNMPPSNHNHVRQQALLQTANKSPLFLDLQPPPPPSSQATGANSIGSSGAFPPSVVVVNESSSSGSSGKKKVGGSGSNNKSKRGTAASTANSSPAHKGSAGSSAPHTPGQVQSVTSSAPKKKFTKRKRCGECTGCQLKSNCGVCAPCRNDKSHQICKSRRCEKLVEVKPKCKGGGGVSATTVQTATSDDSTTVGVVVVNEKTEEIEGEVGNASNDDSKNQDLTAVPSSDQSSCNTVPTILNSTKNMKATSQEPLLTDIKHIELSSLHSKIIDPIDASSTDKPLNGKDQILDKKEGGTINSPSNFNPSQLIKPMTTSFHDNTQELAATKQWAQHYYPSRSTSEPSDRTEGTVPAEDGSSAPSTTAYTSYGRQPLVQAPPTSGTGYQQVQGGINTSAPFDQIDPLSLATRAFLSPPLLLSGDPNVIIQSSINTSSPRKSDKSSNCCPVSPMKIGRGSSNVQQSNLFPRLDNTSNEDDKISSKCGSDVMNHNNNNFESLNTSKQYSPYKTPSQSPHHNHQDLLSSSPKKMMKLVPASPGGGVSNFAQLNSQKRPTPAFNGGVFLSTGQSIGNNGQLMMNGGGQWVDDRASHGHQINYQQSTTMLPPVPTNFGLPSRASSFMVASNGLTSNTAPSHSSSGRSSSNSSTSDQEQKVVSSTDWASSANNVAMMGSVGLSLAPASSSSTSTSPDSTTNHLNGLDDSNISSFLTPFL